MDDASTLQIMELTEGEVPPGQVKFLYCTYCGALIYVRFSGEQPGMGDPIKHEQYHRDRGDRV